MCESRRVAAHQPASDPRAVGYTPLTMHCHRRAGIIRHRRRCRRHRHSNGQRRRGFMVLNALGRDAPELSRSCTRRCCRVTPQRASLRCGRSRGRHMSRDMTGATPPPPPHPTVTHLDLSQTQSSPIPPQSEPSHTPPSPVHPAHPIQVRLLHDWDPPNGFATETAANGWQRRRREWGGQSWIAPPHWIGGGDGGGCDAGPPS